MIALVQQHFSVMGTSTTLVDCHLRFITSPLLFFYTLLVVRIVTTMWAKYVIGTLLAKTYGATTVSALSTIPLPSEL